MEYWQLYKFVELKILGIINLEEKKSLRNIVLAKETLFTHSGRIKGVIRSHWYLVATIMQLIYIHLQDKYIEESKSRKVINIILYFICSIIS